jgi:formiminoglutamase
VIGIQENYLTQNIWLDVVNNPFIDFITYEDIFIHEKKNFLQAVAHATTFTDDTHTGIEVDLNCIDNAASGLDSPGGINPLQARQFVSYAAGDTKTAYLHICEGNSVVVSGSKSTEAIGKLICCLVSDFIKAKE